MSAYCTTTELGSLGAVTAEALADIDPADKEKAISALSGLMDDYFGGSSRAELHPPLLTWGDQVRTCCAVLASAQALRTRGYNPEADPAVKETVDFWMKWLEKVSAGDIVPTGVTPSPPDDAAGSSITAIPRAVSSSTRGYSVRGTGLSRGPFQSD